MAKLFSFRKPKLRINKKGKLSLSGGSMRIGGRSGGVNFSRKGVSGSVRTPIGSYNTRRGWTGNCFGVMVMFVVGVSGLATVAVYTFI